VFDRLFKYRFPEELTRAALVAKCCRSNGEGSSQANEPGIRQGFKEPYGELHELPVKRRTNTYSSVAFNHTPRLGFGMWLEPLRRSRRARQHPAHDGGYRLDFHPP
jgi:hypothetical protein